MRRSGTNRAGAGRARPARAQPSHDATVPDGTSRGRTDTIQVVFLKYDGRPHRSYPARWLGEDGDGTWLGVPAGTVARVDGDRETIRQEPHVLLVPKWAWWTAMFNAPPRPTEIYCDVTTPATWGANEVTVIDLDLDVRRRRWGDIERLDEDEFAEHQARFGYPDEVIAQATAASFWLATALGDGTEPFASRFRLWLDQVS
jgi:protein associated with RNAse G/E